MNAKKLVRYLLTLNGRPRDIALGFSLGLFIGMSPFFGLHTFLAIFFSTILKWSRIASLAGIQITNIFTIPLIYPLTFHAGQLVYRIYSPFDLSTDLFAADIWELIRTVPDLVLTLTIGGVMLGLPLAAGAYLVVFHTVKRWQQNRKIPRKTVIQAAALASVLEEKEGRSGRNRNSHNPNGKIHS